MFFYIISDCRSFTGESLPSDMVNVYINFNTAIFFRNIITLLLVVVSSEPHLFA